MKSQSSQSRPNHPHRTSKEKAEILRKHDRSGLSLLAFARKEGLCYASLLRWRCRQGNGTRLVAPPPPAGDPRFVPVSIEAEVVSGDYVLSWPSGRSLRIPRRFDTDSLRGLLSVLEEVR